MASKLAFDIEELKTLRDGTGKVCKELYTQRDNLKKGLEILRKEWRTPAGDYFFKNLDEDWEINITKFENTLETFEKVLIDAINEFEEVLTQAESVKFDLS